MQTIQEKYTNNSNNNNGIKKTNVLDSIKALFVNDRDSSLFGVTRLISRQ